jgi:hypothetical protein
MYLYKSNVIPPKEPTDAKPSPGTLRSLELLQGPRKVKYIGTLGQCLGSTLFAAVRQEANYPPDVDDADVIAVADHLADLLFETEDERLIYKNAVDAGIQSERRVEVDPVAIKRQADFSSIFSGGTRV